jgi:AcrR family transcriptional regulator
MEMALTTKQLGVVQAATEVFLRYGFARTTMADLAQAAGMSRPALYLVFPSKDDVFSAVIHTMGHQLLSEIRTALATMPTVGEKLLFACRNWGAKGYDLVRQYPDSKDILDLSFAAVREVFSEFQALLVELLAETGRETVVSSTLDDLALVIIYSIRGFTEVAKDSEAFVAMIETQVRLVIHALELGE